MKEAVLVSLHFLVLKEVKWVVPPLDQVDLIVMSKNSVLQQFLNTKPG
jgi:hypothetical protein